MTLILEPHNDDCALFCAFPAAAAAPRAHIVTVFRSANQEAQGIPWQVRADESFRAARELGCSWEQLPIPDDAEGITAANLAVALPPVGPGTPVWAPWPQPDGHPQHNLVAEAALLRWGPERVRLYTTYAFPGGPRTTGDPFHPREREHVLLKLRALACFHSQILKGPVRFWMMPLDEFTRPAP